MNNFNKEIQFKVSLFINGDRGYELTKFLEKNKIKICKIYLSKKFLNKSIFKKIRKFNIPTQIISSLKKKKYKRKSKKNRFRNNLWFSLYISKKFFKLTKIWSDQLPCW